ncbi:hypothetical protein BVU76_17430 [Mycolicibacterium porcinum]|nr:hypothetical protein BVU76_17430 [Mycolicibacterium porcinum]
MVAACVLGFALLVAIVWGVALAKDGGQTPLESYIFTVVLTALSIAGGWIIAVLMNQSQSFDRRAAERRQQEDLERSARSAVTRSFRIMGAMGRIQTHSQGEDQHNLAELRTRMRVISEAATMSFDQALDAIEDWRRFAPDVVDNEIDKAEKASIRRKEGWND